MGLSSSVHGNSSCDVRLCKATNFLHTVRRADCDTELLYAELPPVAKSTRATR